MPCPTQGSFGQTSQELNNQGCDALVNHDYAHAEKLFNAAYQEAVKTHDTKRMATAVANLKELYTGQGADDKLKKISAMETQNITFAHAIKPVASAPPTPAYPRVILSPEGGAPKENDIGLFVWLKKFTGQYVHDNYADRMDIDDCQGYAKKIVELSPSHYQVVVDIECKAKADRPDFTDRDLLLIDKRGEQLVLVKATHLDHKNNL